MLIVNVDVIRSNKKKPTELIHIYSQGRQGSLPNLDLVSAVLSIF